MGQRGLRLTRSGSVARFAIAAIVAASVIVVHASAVSASGWATVGSPNRGSGDGLQAVSCTSSINCMAVGSYATGLGFDRTLVESWNGSTWTIASSRNQGTGENVLDGVSCTSATRCVAVGWYISASNGLQTLAERWNGSAWSITASPNMSAGVGALDRLNAVSCTSASSCVAVGDYWNATGGYQTLVESWNGGTWTIVASPDQGNTYNLLDGVSCTSSTSCVAVGWYLPNAAQTLIESWNGSAWTVVASPNQGTGSELSAVSCTSSTRCVAVGWYYWNATQTLVESWNGSTWTVTASPNQGAVSEFSDVSCTSSTRCVAVGDYYIGSSPNHTLVETWNGSAWTVVASPNKGSGSNDLTGVSCTSSTRCVAVGAWSAPAASQTLVETGPA
jgi:hypothetical protein